MARLLLIYHYFYPDDVVSARHFTQLAEGLEEGGHQVDVLTSDRICHRPAESLAAEAKLGAIRVFRVHRRNVDRSSIGSRSFAVSIFMIQLLWHLLRLQRANRYDQVIIGTDPPLFFVAAGFLRRLGLIPQILLWSFDLYPEAAVAAGKISPANPLYRVLKAGARFAYGSIETIVSIGPCMSRRIMREGHRPLPVIVPWSIAEPVRPEAFPIDHAAVSELRLLYSGNLGLAHSTEALASLASAEAPIKLLIQIAGRGQKFDAFATKPDGRNAVSVLPFVTEAELPARLSAADVHIVTLEPAWSGVVVPSKFFSALAYGRPVLYFGPETSAVAHWIKEYNIGWVVADGLEAALQDMCTVFLQPSLRAALRDRCFSTYQKHFSKRVGISGIQALIPIATRFSADDKNG